MTTKIELEWAKTEKEDMKELISKLQYFRRKWKNSLFSLQEREIRTLEKTLIRIKKMYLN